MSAAAIGGMRPRTKGRLAGAAEALEGLTATYGQVIVTGKLVVGGDAAATAANLIANEKLYWLGLASCLVGVLFHIVWGALFYDLFRVVNRGLARLSALVVVVACSIQAVAAVLYLAPWLILHGGGSMAAFSEEQRQLLALWFFRWNDYAFEIYLVFFGFWCLLIGILIFRSTFLPWILGVLLMIDGLAWMLYLSPPLGRQLFPYIAIASALSEIPLQLWLLIFGVNEQRWTEQASAAA